MEDPQIPPLTPTSTKFRSFSSATPKTPLRPSPTPCQPKYSHPYGIKSTSSGVLSSAAVSSSPNNASSTHGYQQHKSSKSIHSLLRNSSSVDDLAASALSPGSPLSSSHGKQDHGRGAKWTGFKYDSIGTRKRTLAQRASMSDLATIAQNSPGGRALECLASPRKKVGELREEWSRAGMERGGDRLLRNGYEEREMWMEDLGKLPKNPKQWTSKDELSEHAGSRADGMSNDIAAELATFVDLALKFESASVDTPKTIVRSTSGPTLTPSSKVNQITHRALPSAVIEEIKSWIYRQRLDGKAFIRGEDSHWAMSEQAPPFLPILLSLSRHVRRASKRGNVALRHSALSLDSGDDPFQKDSATSAYERHLKDSSVLQETNENEDAQDAALDLLDDEAVISHVRQVAARFDRRSFDGKHFPDFGQEEHDIFSPLPRPMLKPRTMSLSSSHSPASLLGMEAGDGVRVAERAALFEGGAVGRHTLKTAEEREGKVLERESVDGSGIFGRTKAPHAKVTDLDATIKPNILGSAAVNLHGDVTTIVRSAETALSQLSDADSSDGTDLPAVPAQLAAGYLDHHYHPVNPNVGLAPVSSGNGDTAETADAFAETSENELSGSAPRDSLKSGPKAAPLICTDEDVHSASPHMSRMTAHEKAGLKPYGALRRAYSTPVPRYYETRKLDFDPTASVDTGAQPTTRGHARAVIPVCRDFSVPTSSDPQWSGQSYRPVSMSSSRLERRQASRLFSFDSPVYRSCIPRDHTSVTSCDPLQETENSLAAAHARIGALEQALAEVIQEKAILQKHLNFIEVESSTNGRESDYSTRASSHTTEQAPTVTILWRWLTTGQTASPPSPFGPPQSLGQLPGYVFLVGVGLSVIVARVVLSRPLARGK
ncbi:hypothetical protein NCC49_001836 [Naganishia albida]|nr:hypothetical protein NCC49_001836 [Naganishia albida]